MSGLCSVFLAAEKFLNIFGFVFFCISIVGRVWRGAARRIASRRLQEVLFGGCSLVYIANPVDHLADDRSVGFYELLE